ncbi:hypothetical protein BT69DRAFT_1317671 [Atractiella rhizophila]|nr:hypothetical protein BT69DRAFT_1317671 [Atractiella rhizophila]
MASYLPPAYYTPEEPTSPSYPSNPSTSNPKRPAHSSHSSTSAYDVFPSNLGKRPREEEAVFGGGGGGGAGAGAGDPNGTSNGHGMGVFPPTPDPYNTPSKSAKFSSVSSSRDRDKGKGKERERESREQEPELDLSLLYDDPQGFYAHILPTLGPQGREEVMRELERCLPVVTEGTVGFGEVVERTLGRLWEDLMGIQETWSSMTDKARKHALLNYVFSLRRQLLKIHVLSTYSRAVSPAVSRCMNIILYLERHMGHAFNLASVLQQIVDTFPAGRGKPWDLRGSLEVGRRGDWERGMPGVFESYFSRPERLEKDVILDLFGRLDECIRLRLQNEILPVGMRRYEIHSGKAWFSLPDNLATFSVSLSGENEEDRWYLFGVEFGFDVMKVGREGGRWSRKVKGAVRDNIRGVADVELAPRFVPPVGRMKEMEGEGGKEKKWRDAPLTRLWNFMGPYPPPSPLFSFARLVCWLRGTIVTLTYEYRMHALYAQALALGRDGVWGPHIKVDMSRDFRMLTIQYWVNSNPLPSNAFPRDTPPQTLPTRGKLQFILRPSLPPSNLQNHLQALLTRRQRKREREDWVVSDEPKEKEMVVLWSAERVDREVLEREIRFDERFVLEEVLEDVCKRHAGWLVRKEWWPVFLKEGEKCGFEEGKTMRLVEGARSGVEVELREGRKLRFGVETRSGRLEILALNTRREQGGEQEGEERWETGRYDPAAGAANFDRLGLPHRALAMKIHSVLEEVERTADFLGLESHRKIPIQPQELSKFGPSRFTLFISLAHFSTYYLVVVMTDTCLKYALVHLQQTLDAEGGMGLGIENVTWVESPGSKKGKEKEGSGNGGVAGFALSHQSLLDLYRFCLLRVSINQVEMQLASRGIPWKMSESQRTSPPRPDGSVDPSSYVPIMRLESKALFGTAEIVKFMVAEQSMLAVKMLDDEARSFEIKLHIRLHPLLIPTETSWFPPSASFNSKHSIISLTSKTLEKCLFELLTTLAPILRTLYRIFQDRHPRPPRAPTCLHRMPNIWTYHPPNEHPPIDDKGSQPILPASQSNPTQPQSSKS